MHISRNGDHHDHIMALVLLVKLSQLIKVSCRYIIQHTMQYGLKSGPFYLPAGATSYSNSYFGRGTGGIFLDNLYCTGRESRLVDCSHSGIGNHNCDHSADAGLRCQGVSIDIANSSLI